MKNRRKSGNINDKSNEEDYYSILFIYFSDVEGKRDFVETKERDGEEEEVEEGKDKHIEKKKNAREEKKRFSFATSPTDRSAVRMLDNWQ